MSTLQYRSSIALATALVALLSPRPAEAQISDDLGSSPYNFTLTNNLITGVQYDIVNKIKAERRLGYLQNKLARDSQRGNAAAAERDVRQIERDKYRIAVDCWLIRKNSLQYPGYYPVRTDPCSAEAIAQVASPSQVPLRPQP